MPPVRELDWRAHPEHVAAALAAGVWFDIAPAWVVELMVRRSDPFDHDGPD